MKPRIETLTEKKLMGMKMILSLSENKTSELWRSFMPRRKEIKNSIGSYLYSMQVYNPSYFHNFNPDNSFEKWATVEVSDFDAIPDGMESFTLTGGLYAVFEYKGLNTDTKIFQYIFQTWLPTSDYELANRPHFEVLGEKYKNNHPDSEEEIGIPIQPKQP